MRYLNTALLAGIALMLGFQTYQTWRPDLCPSCGADLATTTRELNDVEVILRSHGCDPDRRGFCQNGFRP